MEKNTVNKCIMNWMGSLSKAKRQLPISQLVIPGSHDSGAYMLDVNGPLAPGEPQFFEFLKPAVHNWSITQDHDFQQQLNIGIRYFDLRVAPHPTTKILHLVHGLFGKEVGSCLNEIKAFLNEQLSEVVILDFQHLLNFCDEDNQHLIQIIKECFGNMLAPRQDSLESTTLSSLTAARKQVIVFYDKPLSVEFLWPRCFINSEWPNVQNTTDLLAFLNRTLPKRNLNNCFVSQGVLTPDMGTITTKLLSTLKVWEKDNHVKERILEWVVTLPDKNLLNTVIVDFVNEGFAAVLIGCNA